MPIPLVVTRPTKVNGSHHGDDPLLKQTGIQIATKFLPGPPTRAHCELIGVKTMSLGNGILVDYVYRLQQLKSVPRRNVTKWVVIEAYRVFCFGFVWFPCMAINVIVQYDDRSLPDNLLSTQAPIFVWFDDNTTYDSPLLRLFSGEQRCLVFSGLCWHVICRSPSSLSSNLWIKPYLLYVT